MEAARGETWPLPCPAHPIIAVLRKKTPLYILFKDVFPSWPNIKFFLLFLFLFAYVFIFSFSPTMFCVCVCVCMCCDWLPHCDYCSVCLLVCVHRFDQYSCQDITMLKGAEVRGSKGNHA